MPDIILFDDRNIRTQLVESEQKWCFLVIDVIEVLTNSTLARKYWNALKTKLQQEGSQRSQK